MGGKRSGTIITHPDMSGYVSDGKDEPIVPEEVNISDALAMAQIMLLRALELDTMGRITVDERAYIHSFASHLEQKIAEIDVIAKKARQSMANRTLYLKKRKLVDSQKRTMINVSLQNEDHTVLKPYKRAYSSKRRFHK